MHLVATNAPGTAMTTHIPFRRAQGIPYRTKSR
ncbi:uncharacterized protein CMC5_055780 [Chondromyces crocatus]|uniref:Uncharacterized protein n=1 Tax=Chondromyces crocatus TaxID=52 RepID=A0A0K1EL85_CHOCO|nr:uncharacterized protein CMC5_055780 [Chondromyces crocatus]